MGRWLRSERGLSVPGGMLAAAGVAAILAGSYVYSQGLIRVSVQEKRPGGDHIRLVVPGVVVPVLMALVPASEIGKHMPAEARQHLPLVQAAMDELQKLPDCTLVEVEGRGEQVRVRVREGLMVVDVNDSGDEVHVTLPLSSLRSVLAKLSRASDIIVSSEDDGDQTHSWRHPEHRSDRCSDADDQGSGGGSKEAL